MGLRQMLSIKEGALTRILLILNEKDKIDALRNCFLESYLDRISIFFDLYFECLRKTGNWNSVRNMSDDKFITMFQMKGGLYPACDQFRDSAVQAVNTYQDLIDHLFANDPAKRSQWLILLNRYILDKRDSQDNIKRDFNNQQKKPGFTDKKYQRLGRGLDNSEEIYDPDLKTK